MGLFYTGKGDTGKSDLGGKKIDKTSPEIEAVGELDELNSLLGLIRSQEKQNDYRDLLLAVQENLFTIQAHIGSRMMNADPPEFSDQKVRELEAIIDAFEARLRPERGFIVSGESTAASWLDYARAVARRTERTLIALRKKEPAGMANISVLAYMNRLSSLLYAMARDSANREQRKEKHPDYS